MSNKAVIEYAVLFKSLYISSLYGTNRLRSPLSIWRPTRLKTLTWLTRLATNKAKKIQDIPDIFTGFFLKLSYCTLNCPSSKGSHAPTQKFERPNGKNTKSKNVLKLVKNWWGQLTWKLNEAISSKIWIESKQSETNENQWRFLIILHLKPKTLLY